MPIWHFHQGEGIQFISHGIMGFDFL